MEFSPVMFLKNTGERYSACGLKHIFPAIFFTRPTIASCSALTYLDRSSGKPRKPCKREKKACPKGSQARINLNCLLAAVIPRTQGIRKKTDAL